MISTSSPSFYTITAHGEAAELITSAFSPGTMADITNVVILSKRYTNDIEPMNELQDAVDLIKEGLGEQVQEDVEFNPLFIPMPIEALDEALDVEQKNDLVRFSTMGGNPFTIKSVQIKNSNEDLILAGSVSYEPFELPGYEVIMSNQRNMVLN